MPITHAFVNGKADGADTTVTRPSDWNANHTGYSVATHGYATVVTDEASVTGAYGNLATIGPAVTVTINTKVKVTLAFDGYSALGSTFGRMAVALSGANTVAAGDTQSLGMTDTTAGSNAAQASRVLYFSGLTPGSTTFTAKYFGSSTNFHHRYREILVECMD